MKLIVYLLLNISIFFIGSLYWLFAFVLLISFSLFFVEIPWKKIKNFLVVAITSSVLIVSVHVLSDSIYDGIIVALQLLTIVLFSCLFVCTTHEIDLLNSIEALLKPLKKLGMNVEKLHLAILLTIRSIAVIARQFQQIREAQKARGLGNNVLAVIMPLLLKIFRAANHITDALIARGCDPD